MSLSSVKVTYWKYFEADLKEYYATHPEEVEGETYDQWLERLDLDFILEIAGR